MEWKKDIDKLFCYKGVNILIVSGKVFCIWMKKGTNCWGYLYAGNIFTTKNYESINKLPTG